MKKISGHCHCGQNQLQVAGEPEFQFICYCNDCKRINSGGHLCGILFDEMNLVHMNQEVSTYCYPGGSGNDIKLYFCSRCATHLYAFPTEYPGKIVIRANTLDSDLFHPSQGLFKESAFSWDKEKRRWL